MNGALRADLLAAATALVDKGESPMVAAQRVGISKSTLYNHLKDRTLQGQLPDTIATQKPTRVVEPPPDEDEPLDPSLIDPTASPLEIVRGMLAQVLAHLKSLPKESAKFNPGVAQARQLVKQLAELEKTMAGKETPEQAEERRRREDAETVHVIEQYVLQAELDAARPRPGAPYGVCVTCGAPMQSTEEAA